MGRRSLGAILAGGRSSRFGSDKRRAELGGVTLLSRVQESMRGAVDDLLVVTGEGEPLPGLDLVTIADVFPSTGPLGGIHAALLYARDRGSAGALIVGCDTPFLPAALLREVVSAATSGTCLALAPESGGRRVVEPLCAWYSCAALPAIETALVAGQLSPHLLLAELRASRLPFAVVRQYGDPSHIFRNVNTPDDLAAAEASLPGM